MKQYLLERILSLAQPTYCNWNQSITQFEAMKVLHSIFYMLPAWNIPYDK